MIKQLKSLMKDQRGNLAVSFAMGAAVIVAAGGGVIDFAKQSKAKSELQGAVDAASVAAVREMQLAGATEDAIKATASNFVLASLDKKTKVVKVDVDVRQQDGTVEVTATAPVDTPFFGMVGIGKQKFVNAASRARILGGLPLCVLALEKTEEKAIGIYSQAELSARNCALYANSTSSNAIEALGQSTLETGLTCSAGGVNGGNSNYKNPPITDCPKVPDPLTSKIPPAVIGCDFTNHEVNEGTVTLSPGVYCGGLNITGKADVTFSPGDYIIKDGMLSFTGQAMIAGSDVAFYLTGSLSNLAFHGQADIDLTGREQGNLSGLLFMEDPEDPADLLHEITAQKTRRLEGTIYLPKGELQVSNKSAKSGGGNNVGGIASQSAYTVIIARRLTLTSSPKLVLNTDYASSNVPVPQNIKQISGKIYIDK